MKLRQDLEILLSNVPDRFLSYLKEGSYDELTEESVKHLQAKVALLFGSKQVDEDRHWLKLYYALSLWPDASIFTQFHFIEFAITAALVETRDHHEQVTGSKLLTDLPLIFVVFNELREMGIALTELDFPKITKFPAFTCFENVVCCALDMTLDDATIKALCAGKTIDLITPPEGRNSSILSQLISLKHWSLLWDFLASDFIQSDNLGCLTEAYDDIQAFTHNKPRTTPSVAVVPATQALTLPRALWQDAIIPRLNFHDQMRLARVNRTFYHLMAPLRQFRREFALVFGAGLLAETETQNPGTGHGAQNYNTISATLQSRGSCGESIRSFLRTIGNSDLAAFTETCQASLTQLDEESLNTLFMHVVSSDNLSFLIYLMAKAPQSMPLLITFAATSGALHVMRFLRLADPNNQFLQLGHYLEIACRMQHVPLVRLLAPLAPAKTLKKCFTLACGLPNARVALCLVQEGKDYPANIFLGLAMNSQKMAIVVAYLLAQYPPEPINSPEIIMDNRGMFRRAGVSVVSSIVALMQQPVWQAMVAHPLESLVAHLNHLVGYLSSPATVAVFFEALQQYKGRLDPTLMRCLVLRAMSAENTDALRVLYQQPGMDINAGYFEPPLVLACEQQVTPNVLACLIVLGARFTPLALDKAIEHGKILHVKRLLEMPDAIAELSMKNARYGNSFYHHPFYEACKRGQLEIVELLLAKIDIFSELNDKGQHWFLREAALMGVKSQKNNEATQLKICELLFARCRLAKPGAGLILLAIDLGFTSIIPRLVALGAEPHNPNRNDKVSPFQAAIQQQQYPCLVALLNTPQYAAASYPNIPAVLDIYRGILNELHPGVVTQIYMQHPGYFYALSTDTAPFRSIEEAIIKQTLAGWEIGVWSFSRMTVNGQKYRAPSGVCEIMSFIDTLKNTPYPACLDLLRKTAEAIQRVANSKAGAAGMGIFGKRHDSTIEIFRQILNLVGGMLNPVKGNAQVLDKQ